MVSLGDLWVQHRGRPNGWTMGGPLGRTDGLRWPGFGGEHPKLMAVELLMTCVSKKVLSHLGFRVCKLEPLQAWEILPLQILRKIGPLSGSACNWESSEEARGSMVDSSILSAFRTLERWSNAQLNPRVLVLFDRILLYFESPEDIYINMYLYLCIYIYTYVYK